MDKIKKIKITDILAIFVVIIAIPIGLILKLIKKIQKKPIWLVCELKDMCRDNGYHFYKYIREQHPEINCYYAIDKKCNDYKKVEKYGNIIQFASFKHFVYYIAAQWNLSSHKEGNPNHAVFTLLHLYLHLFNNRIFLQHGITKDNVEMFYYKNTYYKKFVCGAKPEYEYIKLKFGYPDKNVMYTGFPRFDSLHNIDVNKKQILIIPTWRKWFEGYTYKDKEKFMSSNYYKKWNELLNSSKLYDFAKENDIEILFYPHYQMQKFAECFNTQNENIKILSLKDVDIQEILKNSAIMITDYSSVFMDFAYMHKPIVYYQFDYNEYRGTHLKEGYFSYTRDGFGDVECNADDVVESLKKIYNNNCEQEMKYKNRTDEFFELYDSKNCERVYESIIGE